MEKSVHHERDPANGHERFRNAGRGAPEARADAGGENHGLGDGRHSGHLNTKDIGARFAECGAARHVHVTFLGLANTSDPARGGTAPGLEAAHPHDRFERDTIEILKRLSRRPIDPGPQSKLLADLGFDSLQVLELVGELEDHFNIAVPLNSLTHIRTVAEIAGEVRRLVAELEARS
jgi:acyl carrier protein